MGLIPKNDIAAELIARLSCSRHPLGSYFGGTTYCLGVAVQDVGDAFKLGSEVGAEVENVGEISFDQMGNQHYVVFRSAEVSMAEGV